MTILNEPKQINSELKEFMWQEIWRAIKLSREGEMELSLQDIVSILKDIFDEEEIKIIKEKL